MAQWRHTGGKESTSQPTFTLKSDLHLALSHNINIEPTGPCTLIAHKPTAEVQNAADAAQSRPYAALFDVCIRKIPPYSRVGIRDL